MLTALLAGLGVAIGATLAYFKYSALQQELRSMRAQLHQAETHDTTDAEPDSAQTHAPPLRTERFTEIGPLAAGVAHEINNPLTFLAMNAAVLQDMVNDQKIDYLAIDDVLKDINHGVTRIQGVTSELSDLAQTISDPMESTSLHELVERTIHMCLIEIPENVEIKVEVSPMPLVIVSARRMEQIITSLVQNAAEASADEGGTVVVRSGHTPSQCWVEVSDTGVTMTTDTQKRLFEPFFSAKRGGRGTGLGMYPVRCYIEGLGGSIQVESTPERGTIMRIHVPVEPPIPA